MSFEEYRITEKGMELAVKILADGGFLDNMEPTENVIKNFVMLKSACAKFIEASIAKGEARSHQESLDAVAIAFFEAYLEAVTQSVN